MRGTISISVMALLLAGTTLAGAQNPNQPQPQLDTPQKQDLPIDHEKERAKQNAGQTNDKGSDADPNKGRGRTPETGQAMGMPPSPPDSADSNAMANLPGVSPETIPAKFSEDIARQDELKTTERPLALTGQQKSVILQKLAEAKNTPNVSTPGLYAEPGTLIPNEISGQELPPELQANIPGLKGLKYLKKDEQVLLIMPANGIVRNVLQ